MRIFTSTTFSAFSIIFSISFLTTSCINYQYLTMSANDTQLDDQNRIVKERDSVMITYDFSGKNGPVGIYVFNKSTQPLEIDWRRSSLIIGDRPYTMFPSGVKLNGEITRSGLRGTSSASFQGEIEQPAGVDFIPPGSVINWDGLFLRNRRFDLSKYPTTKERVKADAGFQKKMLKASFSVDNSPYRARIYLTFLRPGRGEILFAIDQLFYLSEVVETHATPAFIVPDRGNNGNRFYINF